MIIIIIYYFYYNDYYYLEEVLKQGSYLLVRMACCITYLYRLGHYSQAKTAKEILYTKSILIFGWNTDDLLEPRRRLLN
jgi:hypothetical protein